MTDTALRIYGPALLTNAAATLFTVPGATTYILRNMRIVNDTAGAITATVSIGADALGKRILPLGFSIPANSSYDWSGFMVMTAAEIMQGYASALNSLTIEISGVSVT